MLNGDIQVSDQMSFLKAECEWFEVCLEARITGYFEQQENTEFPLPPPVENFIKSGEPDQKTEGYLAIVQEYQLGLTERLVMMLAMMPTLKPHVLDLLFTKNENTDRPFSEFGGVTGESHGGFIPTLETALFMIAGGSIEQKINALQFMGPANGLFKHQLVDLKTTLADEPGSTARLNVPVDVLQRITGFKAPVATMGPDFPAKKISTRLTLDDLIVSDEIRDELDLISTWVKHAKELSANEGIDKFIMPGYRCLFWGPPGTGKTLAAGVLGQTLNTDVYRIDLSVVVSKWIGETEKNLSAVFDEGERNGWILFFDEADALFSRRSVSSSSNDRYSNQQVSYLLQRLESFTGVAILATNLRSNLDDALMRRFQSFVHFSMPAVSQREALWENMLGSFNYDSVDLSKLSEDFELSGGDIASVVQYAHLASLKDGRDEIVTSDLKAGIARVLKRQG